MASEAASFITKFHDLDGTTVGERTKNFFKLLNENRSLGQSTEALNLISSNLTPKTYLESLFKLDFLIFFRRIPEMMDYLREGNDVYVSKIAKQVWFFKTAFNGVHANDLVNNILPHMSYCVRMKILNKLSKCLDDEDFDKIFDAVVTRYGIFVASTFILGCSPNKIKDVLHSYKIKHLSSVHLKVMYKKDPSLINIYYDKYPLNKYCQHEFLRFLWSEDVALHKELQEKFRFSFKLGRRNTKKFFIAHKNDIIKDPFNYAYKIDMRAVMRKLGKESEALICNSLPIYAEAFKLETDVLGIPHKYLYKLYFQTIPHHFNKRIYDYPQFITEKLLELVCDPRERANLAKIRIDEDSNNFNRFVKYLQCEEAIPLIKEKINVTSKIESRSELTVILVETCKINNDLTALTEVIKYFYIRHKNDDKSVIFKFIKTIEKNFNLHKFNEETWNALNDLFVDYALKYNTDPTVQEKLHLIPLLYANCGSFIMLTKAYMEFLFKNNRLTDELVSNYLCSKTFYICGDYNIEFQKYILLFAIEHSDKIAEKLKKSKEDNDLVLIEFLLIWKETHKDDELSLYDFPNLVKYFKDVARFLKRLPRSIRSHLRQKIFTFEDNPHKRDYFEIYWRDRHENYFDRSDLVWFLKYNPQMLVDNFDYVANDILNLLNTKKRPALKMRSKIKHTLHFFKKYSNLNLDRKIIDYCMSDLENDSKVDKLPVIQALAIFLSSQKYIELAEFYKPSHKKLDLKSEEQLRQYNMQCLIAANFKYTNDYKVLDTLLEYFAGDFLKHALTSFFSLIHKTPENRIDNYLNSIANKAVSVRKHSLFCTSILCNASLIEEKFKKLIEEETDASLQKRIVKSAISHFLRNPLDSSLEIVKFSFVFVKEEDDESLEELVESAALIPRKYEAQFFVYVWEYLEKIIKRPKTLLNLQFKLIASPNSELAEDLPLNFALNIVKENLSKIDGLSPETVADFAFNLLIKKEEKKVVLDTIFKIIDESENPLKFIWLFKKYTRNILRLTSDQNIDFVPYFVRYWQSKIVPLDNFKEFLELFYLQTKFEIHRDNTVEQFGVRAVPYFEKVLQDYGQLIVNFLKDSFKELVKYFCCGEVSEFCYYQFILEQNPSSAVVIMLINLLPATDRSLSMKDYQIYKAMVTKIKSLPDPAVKIHARYKFQ